MVESKLVQNLCNGYPTILRRDIEGIINIIISEIIDALKRDESVEIRGWGRFKTVVRKARLGRNPQNSKAVNISEKKVIRWKMSKILYKKLNKKNEF